MREFSYWNKCFSDNNLFEFNKNEYGLLWLKIKSIIRKDLIAEFIQDNNITLNANTLSKQFEELYTILKYNIEDANTKLNEFLKKKEEEELRNLNEDNLVNELYKLQNFTWGGNYNNSLDKDLVSRYVKVYSSYDELVSKFNAINLDAQNYVLNSWYNNWSSILIEHIFKSHKKVISAIGKIKSVDFFINDIPFDLKVTYLPKEYIHQKRKERKIISELSFLKQQAKDDNISFDINAKEKDIEYEIIEKMKDKDDNFCKNTLKCIKETNLLILQEAKDNPKQLAKWLYENQGEMRFGSENRIFLVLVDSNDFNNSWKLKRNIELLKPKITKYLNNFIYTKDNIDDLKIEFNYKNKTYTTLTDIIFIIK